MKLGIVEIARMTEDEARTFLEKIRWPDGVACPHCGAVDSSTRMHGTAHRPGLFQCNACRGQFTVTTGTIMHRSHVTLTQWVLAFYLMCSSKKGVSALQLQRQLLFTRDSFSRMRKIKWVVLAIAGLSTCAGMCLLLFVGF